MRNLLKTNKPKVAKKRRILKFVDENRRKKQKRSLLGLFY